MLALSSPFARDIVSTRLSHNFYCKCIKNVLTLKMKVVIMEHNHNGTIRWQLNKSIKATYLRKLSPFLIYYDFKFVTLKFRLMSWSIRNDAIQWRISTSLDSTSIHCKCQDQGHEYFYFKYPVKRQQIRQSLQFPSNRSLQFAFDWHIYI